MKSLIRPTIVVLSLLVTSCTKQVKEYTCQCYYDDDTPSVSIPLKTGDLQFAKTQCKDYESPGSYNRHHCKVLE